jgi:hypothetical protein
VICHTERGISPLSLTRSPFPAYSSPDAVGRLVRAEAENPLSKKKPQTIGARGSAWQFTIVGF